jgi:hypothetical protein
MPNVPIGVIPYLIQGMELVLLKTEMALYEVISGAKPMLDLN